MAHGERGEGATTYLTRSEASQFSTLQELLDKCGSEHLGMWGLCQSETKVEFGKSRPGHRLIVTMFDILRYAQEKEFEGWSTSNLLVLHGRDCSTGVCHYQLLKFDCPFERSEEYKTPFARAL